MKKKSGKIHALLLGLTVLFSISSGIAGPKDKILREHRASQFDLDQEGENALTLAVKSGDVETARTLLRSWFPVNAPNKDYSTPLDIALTNKNMEMIRLLIEFRATLVNSYTGSTIWHRLAGDKVEPELQNEIIKLLSVHKLGINQPDMYTLTPLHYAASNRNLDRVKFLLALGANPYLKDKFGETALHKAARNHDTEILTTLLNAGVPVDETDHYGNTPLAIANLISYQEVQDVGDPYYNTVDLLRSRGANPEHQNQGGTRAGIPFGTREWPYRDYVRKSEEKSLETQLSVESKPHEVQLPSHPHPLPPPPAPPSPPAPKAIKCDSAPGMFESLHPVLSVIQANTEITQEVLHPEISDNNDDAACTPAYFHLSSQSKRERHLGNITGPFSNLSKVEQMRQGTVEGDTVLGNTLFLADGPDDFSFDQGINAERLLQLKKLNPAIVGKITKTDLKIRNPQEGDLLSRRTLDLHSAESWHVATHGEKYDSIIMKNGICCCCNENTTCAGMTKENSQALINQVLEHLSPGGHAFLWTSSSTARADKIYEKWRKISSDIKFPAGVSVQETYDPSRGNFALIIQKHD